IQTPTPGTLLKREGNFQVTGTGTPGNTIDVRTELIYATESNPTYEHKNSSAGNKATIDRSGNWTVTTSAPGYTEPDYVNARVVIAARERHREDQSLASHETLREVSIEVPPRREP